MSLVIAVGRQVEINPEKCTLVVDFGPLPNFAFGALFIIGFGAYSPGPGF
jgi:hypothetical protein